MTHPRVALLAMTLLIGPAATASAQMIVGPTPGPAPGPGPGAGSGMTVGPGPGSGSGMTVGPGPGMPGPGMGAPAMAPGGAGGMPPCLQAFLPMREEAEKRAGVLQAGIQHKKPRPEICNLFRRFSDAEEKVVKYATANQASCGIPPDAVAQMKKNHVKTAEVRDRVCAADAPAKPAGPNLGEALGTRSLPTSETTRAGTGTLDTLSGNPLAR